MSTFVRIADDPLEGRLTMSANWAYAANGTERASQGTEFATPHRPPVLGTTHDLVTLLSLPNETKVRISAGVRGRIAEAQRKRWAAAKRK
jgi:hypothetical protein